MSDYFNENKNFLKLEKEILKIEEIHPIKNDEELVFAIDLVIHKEWDLPYEERDFDMLHEAIKIMASLVGIETMDLEDRANLCADKILRRIKEEKE